jgi:pimeloyl-ACP methyl ester carboxylesterase
MSPAKRSATETVRSSDGTTIAFERAGSGPALILVDGAFCSRKMGPSAALAEQLARHFTVFIYDRRGRGESGDTAPYAVAREIEDLGALIAAAGGSAFVCGISSGAGLALEAANHGLAIAKLALYEAPFIVDATRAPIPAGYAAKIAEAIAGDRRGDVIKIFMTEGVGLSGIIVLLMRIMPGWSGMKRAAHTVAYDVAIVAEHERGQPLPADRWTSVTMPTLVIDGSKSPAWMRNAMSALAAVLPAAQHRTLAGQTHMVNAKVLAPVLVELFTSGKGSVG